MSKAGMRERTAVKVMVMMRTLAVGSTFLNESIALIRVSDPPYMFKAVTEIRPSVEKTRAIDPKPGNTRSPAAFSDAIVSKSVPAQAANADPKHISQMAPSAEPQYVPQEGLADGHRRGKVAGVVRNIDGPADLIAGDRAELDEEGCPFKATDVERTRRIIDRADGDRDEPENDQEAGSQPPLHTVDEVVADERHDRGHDGGNDDPHLGSGHERSRAGRRRPNIVLKMLKPAY